MFAFGSGVMASMYIIHARHSGDDRFNLSIMSKKVSLLMVPVIAWAVRVQSCFCLDDVGRVV